MPFFRNFFYRLGSILRKLKNDLNKVPTTSTLLPETYAIRDNRSIISGSKNVYRIKKKKKKSHIIVKPIHSSLRSESKIDKYFIAIKLYKKYIKTIY